MDSYSFNFKYMNHRGSFKHLQPTPCLQNTVEAVCVCEDMHVCVREGAERKK